MFFTYLAWGLAAFFLGAIPFGFVAGKLKGIDLREQGSGNIGATNTLRVLGVPAGVAVLLLDTFKGFLPVFLARQYLSPGGIGADAGGWGPVLVGIATVLGHIYSPFVRFKGGKGVATALGVLLGLAPLIALAAFAVFLVTVWLTRYVSLGSLLAALTQGVLFWTLPGQSRASQVFGTVVGLFVIVRHRENIRRLRSGTESRFGSKPKAAPAAVPENAPGEEEATPQPPPGA
ncbi:MAG TPA: glycerol-3-phosphate 1-O-acyltransferase PlsY [Armatimonadaceae bacterium]|nr:glycerol-3-phosphate 1-O-acyltransferase PlsY [Armatimonadaceae bacterium]